ncbi:MAG: hypothetical protein OXN97_07880 [Bryobacterales bacterium]|nr:hypothetical protein [Bryobacterales bacterium]
MYRTRERTLKCRVVDGFFGSVLWLPPGGYGGFCGSMNVRFVTDVPVLVA